MKTKEELLKIYSAYLPYELRFISKKDLSLKDSWVMSGLKTNFRFYDAKPILYSMDMLTKEIEHKGERFIPAEILFGGIRPNTSKSTYLHDCEKWPLMMNYKIVEKLLEWLFNVFGLEESEYIKKENLKTESNDPK